MKLKQIFLALFLLPLITNAQVRPDIYSFTPQERDTLVNAMMEFITPEVIE
jgi:hypothetical protein